MIGMVPVVVIYDALIFTHDETWLRNLLGF
jgi:hypothetical protein